MLLLPAGCYHLNVGIMMPEEPIGFAAVAPALEFICWVLVMLIPFLRWVNGAAVTDDQFSIQYTLAAIALAGALSLRLYNRRRR